MERQRSGSRILQACPESSAMNVPSYPGGPFVIPYTVAVMAISFQEAQKKSAENKQRFHKLRRLQNL